MEALRLGRTNIIAARCGFGALPIQRVGIDEAKLLLRMAYDNGINFFDTARGYTDSEEKIGHALSDVRNHIFIASKSHAKDKKSLIHEMETSLKALKTDMIDLYQLHNPSIIPNYDDPDGLYQGLLDAKAKGLIRFIGLTNHHLDLAMQVAREKRFDTIQFPLSSLSTYVGGIQ